MVLYTQYSIEDGLNSRSLTLRITDETSITPLLGNGFSASSSQFQPPHSNRIWKRAFHHLRGDRSWLRQTSDLDGLVDHVTGGWGYRGPKHESNWVSTSIDLEWCIWEISRRLTVLQRDTVELTVIKRNEKFSRNYKGCKDLQVDPMTHLPKYRTRAPDQEKCQAAVNFASASSELLYFGRIFKKDVLETTEWTEDVTGLILPEWCYRSRKRWYTGQSWLDRLVWNPREDSSVIAKQKMDARRIQIQTSRQ